MTVSQKPPQRVPSFAKSLKKAYAYFEAVKSEFWKIQWTEGSEVKGYAKAVLGATFVFGMLIYVMDLVVQKVLYGFDSIFRWIVG